jgi:hypothetical protein
VPRLYPIPHEGSAQEPGRWRHSYLDPSRTGTQFWDALRLQIELVVGPEPKAGRPDRRARVSAILDTGAYLTVFSQNIWSRFERHLIQFLAPAPQNPGVPLSVAGHRYPVRLGWIWLGVQDDEKPVGRLPAQRVLAQFAEDGGRLRQNVLVGLSESVLTGRSLSRDVTLEVDEPDPILPNVRRPTFGQVWRLMEL